MQCPLISVIVPIYRVEAYLPQCIESILNQTYRNLEIILVDDGSDDRCPKICDDYAQRDSRIIVIHKKNGGPDSARKTGMESSTAEYVSYVDGDDWIEPTMYETLMRLLLNQKVSVVVCGIWDENNGNVHARFPYFPEGKYVGNIFKKKIESKILYTGEFFEAGITVVLWDKLFKKEFLNKYQMLPHNIVPLVDDTLVSIPAILESRSVYITHTCLYHYRVRQSSLKRTIVQNVLHPVIRYYPDWINCLKQVSTNSAIEKQLQYYMLYHLVARCPGALDNPMCGQILNLYGGMRLDAKVIIYGAGVAGIHLRQYLSGISHSSLVAWVDRDYSGFPIEMDISSPEIIPNLEFDYIIIAVTRHKFMKAIKLNLSAIGICPKKIRWVDEQYICHPEIALQKAGIPVERV